MTIRTGFLTCSLLAAVGCSSSLGPGTDAAAGAGGGGGGTGGGAGTSGGGTSAAGTTGTGGVTGTAGGGMDAGPGLCAHPSAAVRALTLADDGTQPRTSFDVPVTVVSVDDCATGVCAPAASIGARVILSEAGGRRWTVLAYFLGLPTNFVSVGDALELQVVFREVPTPFATYSYWTTVLSRAGAPVVFDAASAADLAPYGIVATSLNGIYCFGDCYTYYGASVTYDGETRNVAPMETAQIGKLSFTHRGFGVLGPCDSPSHVESMAGFVAP